MNYEQFQEKYYNDPQGFVTDCIKFKAEESPYPHQLELLRAITEGEKKIAMKTPRLGAGKTTTIAWLILWFALTRDNGDDFGKEGWECSIMTPAHRQYKLIWDEVHKWHGRLDWGIIGRNSLSNKELRKMGMDMSNGKALKILSITECELCENNLILFDEAGPIKCSDFQEAESFVKDSDGLLITVSSHMTTNSKFHDIFKKTTKSWYTISVTAFDMVKIHPEFQGFTDKIKRGWGVGSSQYKQQILGEFTEPETVQQI